MHGIPILEPWAKELGWPTSLVLLTKMRIGCTPSQASIAPRMFCHRFVQYNLFRFDDLRCSGVFGLLALVESVTCTIP